MRKDKNNRYSTGTRTKLSKIGLLNQVSKYSYATKKGISTSKSVAPKSKENQDAYISCARFCDYFHTHFFAVCDGHGTNGKLVSNFLKTHLPAALKTELQRENLLLCTELGSHPPNDK
jgi:serine/threonine protein phosphatase PrpC